MLSPRGLGSVPRDVLARLGNVFYWLAVAIIYLPIACGLVYYLIELLKNPHVALDYFNDEDVKSLLSLWMNLWFITSAISYPTGWTLRYILSGQTDHPVLSFGAGHDKYMYYLGLLIAAAFNITLLVFGYYAFKWIMRQVV